MAGMKKENHLKIKFCGIVDFPGVRQHEIDLMKEIICELGDPVLEENISFDGYYDFPL